MKNIDEIKKLIMDKMDSIEFNELKHSNFLVTGKNMSGKSKLFRDIIKEKTNSYYFIDSVNRTIPIENPSNLFRTNMIKDINENRIKRVNFNKIDVFTSTVNNSIILNELITNFRNYGLRLNAFFGEEFCIVSSKDRFNNIIYKYKIGGTEYSEISSGIQAIVRIIVEITFAEMAGCQLVIIDEIDAHLDNEKCNQLIEFINRSFRTINFLLSTHSADIILKAKDYDIIKIIENNNCEIHDSNDMDDLNYINRTIFSLNKRIDFNKNNTDNILSDFARRLASGYSLSDFDRTYINSIQNLTIKQNVLKKFVLEW